ncbi:MAG: T9SS type A sorting domain-containing protein [Candidatus Electryonea clarkiae]|nr:T9SS type A sorting domain-containing protein [Candidatus Electryonea clarkiae]MDP8287555.1 T9SS type A sorting domain-containing protein [Candidatus Electryonea clarkiae]
MKFLFQKNLAGIIFLCVFFTTSHLLYGKNIDDKLNLNLFQTLGSQEQSFNFNSVNDIRRDYLAETLTIIAIRVDFLPDTLATTTGTGSFFYELPDSIEPEEWQIDPPPHDKQYFKDQILALHNYFKRFSRGKLNIVGKIYPEEDQDAYTLDYPIWHINYGDDDNDRLNRTLTELFVDSWEAAREDLEADGVTVNDSTLFVIFHAGAGNEFDTGFDTTPHDIPSVYIGPEDLETFADLPDAGIPLGNDLITRGVILPETQRQGDVEVGMIGTICTQVGFLMGMRHLYQPDTGDPGIGLLGLMDRGFGGFFGFGPIPPSVWARAYMGWDSVKVVEEGPIELIAQQWLDTLFTEPDTNYHLVKVPINNDEYYLLEARLRDPEEDSVTVAYDRDGRRLTMNYDYSFETGDGFRVPVWVEDHDFDFPSSGILIWHIDESVIREKIDEDRIQEDRNRRGVSLEEADGSEDIGEDYPFLTPGDGAEYGVREDAWYAGNKVWQLANNNARDVVFGPYTNPSTAANSGGASHIIFENFTVLGDTMSCEVSNAWKQGNFPQNLDWNPGSQVSSTFADLTGDGIDELVLYDSKGKIRFFYGDGSMPFNIDQTYDLPINKISHLIAADLDNDGSDELIIAGDATLLIQKYSDAGVLVNEGDPFQFGQQEMISLTISGPEVEPVINVALKNQNEDICRIYSIYRDPAGYNHRYIQIPATAHLRFALLGSEWTDTLAVVDNKGNLSIYRVESFQEPSELFRTPNTEPFETINYLISGDFDGDNMWDIMASASNGNLIFWWGTEDWSEPHVHQLEKQLWKYTAFDIDDDGVVEPVGISGDFPVEVVGIEPGGIFSEDTPIRLPEGTHASGASPLIINQGNRQNKLMICAAQLDDTLGHGVVATNLHLKRPLSGFPLDYGSNQTNLKITIGQIDDDSDIELVMTSIASGGLKVINIPSDPGTSHEILWGMEGGNPRHTYHIFSSPSSVSGLSSTDLENSYCWPNPVIEDVAHFRFQSNSSGNAEIKVFDLVGREVLVKKQAARLGNDQEIALDVSNLPSGVYLARLEVGSNSTLIRFAVVQ